MCRDAVRDESRIKEDIFNVRECFLEIGIAQGSLEYRSATTYNICLDYLALVWERVRRFPMPQKRVVQKLGTAAAYADRKFLCCFPRSLGMCL